MTIIAAMRVMEKTTLYIAKAMPLDSLKVEETLRVVKAIRAPKTRRPPFSKHMT